MKIVAIVQARLKSTRLPGKVLKTIKGKSIIQLIVERLKRSKHINQVIVACPIEDKEIIDHCEKNNILVYGGSSEDVLLRYWEANKRFCGDQIVRITADCPLIDWKIVDKVIEEHKKTDSDFTSNSWLGQETYPDGYDVAIMTAQTLSRLKTEAKEPSEREHVWTYIQTHKERFKTTIVKSGMKYPNMRLTLDYEADLSVIEGIYKQFTDNNFGDKEIQELYAKKPELFQGNIDKKRNENYYKQTGKKK